MPDQLVDQTGERFAICHEWLLYHRDLSSNAKCVYLVLKRHAREKATCFPGQKGIGDKLGLSRRTIYESLQMLQDAGLINIESSTAGKHKTKNTYTLLMVNGQNLPIQKVVERVEITHTHEQNLPPKDKQLKENKDTPGKPDGPSPQKQFTAWFVDEYAKRNPGKKYFFQGGKDGSAIKRLLAHYSLEELKGLVLAGWSTPDRKDFSTRSVCMTIAGFSSMVNQLATKGSGSGVVENYSYDPQSGEKWKVDGKWTNQKPQGWNRSEWEKQRKIG